METAKETSDSFDSFSSLGTYWRALLHTPHRVWQRGCAVSTVTDQMTEVRKFKHASLWPEAIDHSALQRLLLIQSMIFRKRTIIAEHAATASQTSFKFAVHQLGIYCVCMRPGGAVESSCGK
jgi:hypothetical protein